MIRIDRLIKVQAIAISSAMVAAVIGGLVARSWIWAIACAIFVYAGFRVAAMFWVAHMIRTHPDWRGLRYFAAAADDDDDDEGDDWYGSPDQDDDGSGYGVWSEDLARHFGSRDPGRRAIE